MSHQSGLITAPIDVLGDVSPVLGVNSGDVGYLCSNEHGRINKWAKYKPVRFNKVGELAESEFKSSNNNFGLVIPAASKTDDWRDLYKNSSWGYEAPRPGTDWCRITDFNGYKHDAIPLVGTGWEKDKIIEFDLFEKGAWVSVGVYHASKLDPGQLSLEDFRDLGGESLYYTVLGAQVFRVQEYKGDQSKWHDTSIWAGPLSLTSEDGSVGFVASNEKPDYVWAGYDNLKFKIPFPQNTMDDEDIPVYAIVLALIGNSNRYPLPNDSNNYGYCFLRPFYKAWVSVSLMNWSFGDKDSNGNLRLFNIHAPGDPPANWDGTLYAQLFIRNTTEHIVIIGSTGSNQQTQFRSFDNSTSNLPVKGELVDKKGVSIASVTLQPNYASNQQNLAEIYLKLPKVLVNPDPNVCYFVRLYVSHNSGENFVQVAAMQMCLTGIN